MIAVLQRVFIIACSLACLCRFPGDVAQAATDYLVDVWGTDEGLPHSTVTSIAQTPDGYLWIGTLNGGLARFDGVRFVDYQPGNTPQLNSIEIRKLAVDSQGTLWIGNVEGGLISYRNGEFKFERQSAVTPPAWLEGAVFATRDQVLLSSFGGWLWFKDKTLTTNRWRTFVAPDARVPASFCRDSNGLVWYVTRHDWLGRFDGAHFVQVPTNCGLSSLDVRTMIADQKGGIWVGTDKELAVWDGRRFQDMTPTNGGLDSAIRHLAFASDGGLWVMTENKLRKCRNRRWIVEASPWNKSPPDTPQPLIVSGDQAGGVWVAHYGQGLWHADASGKVIHIGKKEGLPNGVVECLYQDTEGNVWVGLSGGGLVRLRHRIFQLEWPRGAAEESAVSSVCQDKSGAMWFATGDGTCFRLFNGSISEHPPPLKSPAGRDIVVAPDARGRVWVGTREGLWVIETNTYYRPIQLNQVRYVARVLFTDRSGRVWIGNELGLYCWDKGRLKTFTKADGFAPAFVASITQDDAGAIWIGTAAGELRRYANGKFTSFSPSDKLGKWPVEMPDDAPTGTGVRRGTLTHGERFWTLYADHQGVIWIGTLGGGLLRFANGKFTRYGTENGLPSEHISQILEDGRGRLWLGTRSGIACVSKEDLNRFARGEIKSFSCVTYGRNDGMPTSECSGGSQPAAWRSTDGRLWFATAKGLVSVQPDLLPFNPHPPPVVIEEVSIEGKIYHPIAKSAGNHEGVPLLMVPPGSHYLEIHFTGLSFTSPDRVRFRWKLEHFDHGWIDGGRKRVASYSFLPPGNYRFQVIACNNDGVWNNKGAMLDVRIEPYFWQMWSVQLGAGLALLGAAASAARYVTVRKTQRKLQKVERQRAVESERARIAKDIHDDLGASLTHIGLLSQSARAQTGDTLRTNADLDQIYDTSRNLVRAMEEIVWAVSPKHDSLDSLANYLGIYAQNFASASGLLCRLDFPLSPSTRVVNSQARHNVFLAFKEALNNVAKHAGATKVRVSLQLADAGFTLAIEDNGHGFQIRPEPGETAARAANPPIGGNGLPNMRSRLKEIGGHCEITSSGQGTRVQFAVPFVT